MDNFMRFKLFGAPIKLKSHAVPRFFNCQPDRTRAARLLPGKATEKLQHKRKIQEILNHENSESDCQQLENVNKITDENLNTLLSSSSAKIMIKEVQDETAASCSSLQKEALNIMENENFNEDLHDNRECALFKKRRVLQENEEQNMQSNDSSKINKFCTKSVQVSLRKSYKSIGIMFKSKTFDKSTSTCDIEGNFIHKAKVQPLNKNFPVIDNQQLDSDFVTSTTTETPSSKTFSEYKLSSGEIRETEEYDLHMKRNALNMIIYSISNNPKRYIGVPEKWLWIIEHLNLATNISTDDIKLTLMKIRQNDTFVRLGNQFGISATKASNIFNTSVLQLAKILKIFIYFPDKKMLSESCPSLFVLIILM